MLNFRPAMVADWVDEKGGAPLAAGWQLGGRGTSDGVDTVGWHVPAPVEGRLPIRLIG
jgi:hypothetical protein